MILDDYKIHQLNVQFQYPDAYEIWDNAGKISRDLVEIWPGLSPQAVEGNQQVLKSDSVQITTGLRMSHIGITTIARRDQFDEQIALTVDVWRQFLALKTLDRVSARSFYRRPYKTLAQANQALVDLKIVRWPESGLFNQPYDSERNTFDVNYRFEDTGGIVSVRVKSQQVKLEILANKDFPDIESSSREENYIIIDLDRATIKPVEAATFSVTEWLKGYHHILRRDLDGLLLGEI